jgi:hypothetical protein
MHWILSKVQTNEFLKGFGCFSNLGQIRNVHFGDDILLFLEASPNNNQTLNECY